MAVIKFEKPRRGFWRLRDFPDVVRLDGRLYKKAFWQQPYPNVVAQYREAVPTNSRHLMVMNDGTFVVDHADGDNPDMGRPVEHLLNDHPIGEAIKVGAVVGGLALLIGALTA